MPTTTPSVATNIFTASTTIGNGTQSGGLTIFGGATTTGNAYFGSNVGIGTTTPWGRLSVTGNDNLITSAALVVANSSNTALLSVLDSGDVDIGTTIRQTRSFRSKATALVSSSMLLRRRAPRASTSVPSATSASPPQTPFALLSLNASGALNEDSTLFNISSSTSYGNTTLSLASFQQLRPAIDRSRTSLRVSGSAQLSVLAGTTTVTRASVQSLVGTLAAIRLASLSKVDMRTSLTRRAALLRPGMYRTRTSATNVGQNVIGQQWRRAEETHVAIEGHYAYIVENGTTNAFEVFDVSNPASPLRVGRTNLANASNYVVVSGHYAYVSENGTTNAFEIFDVSNPSVPVRVSQSNLANGGSGTLAVSGRYAYVAEGSGTIARIRDLRHLQPRIAGAGEPEHACQSGRDR